MGHLLLQIMGTSIDTCHAVPLVYCKYNLQGIASIYADKTGYYNNFLNHDLIWDSLCKQSI